MSDASCSRAVIGRPTADSVFLAGSDVTASAQSVFQMLEFWGFVDEVAGAVADGLLTGQDARFTEFCHCFVNWDLQSPMSVRLR